jgi:hypothetical protein
MFSLGHASTEARGPEMRRVVCGSAILPKKQIRPAAYGQGDAVENLE